jgi:hypothetical protein
MPITQDELVLEAQRIARGKITPEMNSEEKDGVLEAVMMSLLDAKVTVPFFGRVGQAAAGGFGPNTGRVLMHTEPRLPKMPDKPTLIDFFKYRFLLVKRGGMHLLQSGALAMKNGLPEKIVLACLLHDVAVVAYIRTDHGYHGALLLEPYVDEEVSWAIRYHQALRFYADPINGYEYPELYTRAFGEDYVPPDYIKRDAEHARGHRWYMSSRLVTMNDLYSFDPNMNVQIEQFADIIGRHFKQPKEGLGFDGSPSAHMWRSIIWPNNFL